jgi:chromosomal replication initiation ATPase DnaA
MKQNYTFDDFIVHDGNKVAFTAAKKIVEFPGEVFNPFYIYGPEGFGKTHLLSALGDGLKEKSKVDLLTVHEFEQGLTRHRKFDSPLIVDDIHEISDSHKKRLREIVEHALRDNIQLCFSATMPPQDVSGFNQKLCSLMESGLICELSAPAKSVRIEMIRKKADEAGILLSDETVEELARIATGSVGTIESMIKRLVAYSSLGNLAIDANSIGLILKDFYPEKKMYLIPSVLEEVRREDIWSLEDVESPQVRKEYERRIAVWEMRGFDVSMLKEQFSEDSLKLRHVYHDYVEKVRRLIDLQRAFAGVDREQESGEALRIDSMIYNPANVEEIEKSLKAFDEGIESPKEYRKFNEFIIGFCNKIVWDTYHDKVLDSLGVNNPFVIFGENGTGKSHFLEAVCQDLISREKKILFYDLACPVKTDLSGAAARYDILAMDNFHAILTASESVINDIGELADAFTNDAKQVIIASVPIADETSLPAALEGLLDGALVATLEKPSADVTNEYIKRYMPLNAASIIEQGVPEFDSFYDIAYYIRSFDDDASAIVPLGLPGEEQMAWPEIGDEGAMAVERDEKGAPAVLSIDISTGENFMMPEVTSELVEEGF